MSAQERSDADLLAEIERLDAEATTGPWTTGDYNLLGILAPHQHHLGCDPCEGEPEEIIASDGFFPSSRPEEDARFVAAARQLLPDLARRLRERNEHLARLEGTFASAHPDDSFSAASLVRMIRDHATKGVDR